MQYLLMICVDDSFRPPDALEPEVIAWVEEMDRRGVRKLGDRLRPVREAKTLHVRDGKVLLEDGPFAQTKDRIAGFDLIECASMDEAIEVASRHPIAKLGKVEVRQLWGE